MVASLTPFRPFLLALWLTCFAGACATLAGTLQCGAAKVDVTPRKLPVIRNGGFLEAQDNVVLDPLHARALVLDDGTQRIALVVVDSCMIPTDVCDRAKLLAAEKTGMPTDHMLISATHTHTAPSVMDFCLGSRADQEYRDFLPGKIAEAIQLADERRQPARVGFAVADASGHTKCRRWITRTDSLMTDPFGERTVHAMMHPGHLNPAYVGPSGPVDPWLSLLLIQSADGSPLAVLANFSMHYFSGHGGVSADYFGRFADRIASKLAPPGDDCLGIMSQGTSGDLWWGDYSKAADGKPFQDIDQFTNELVDLAVAATEKVQYRAEVALGMVERRVTMTRRTPDDKRLAWARRLNALRGERLPRDQPEVYALQAVHLHEHPTDEVVLQAIRIGDIGITAMPNEVYGLTGLKLKRQSPWAKTFNVSLANGACGYIPPPEQHALGGYNTWPATTAGLEVQAEPKIVESLLELLEQLSGAPRKQYREASSSYSEQIVASKPLAYWRLDEMRGNILHDLETGNHARAAGYVAYHLPGRLGVMGAEHDSHALQLAGGKIIAEDLDLGESYTIELSFYLGTPNDFRDVTGVLLSRGSDELLITGTRDATPGRLAIGEERGRVTIEPGAWHHLVFLRNGDFVQVYLDGASQAEISAKLPVTALLPRRIMIGGDATDSANFEGKFDEVSAFERALGASEIQSHFRGAGVAAAVTSAASQLESDPLSPAESLDKIHVRDGYRVELVVAEPLVQDPVAIDWGLDGRLWVAEMADYPLGIYGQGQPGGRIRWLADTTGDGLYDQSVVFMEHVGFPNGVMAWGKGVLVSAAPEIFYAEDRDGDGVADFKETLLSGFMEANQQLRVNGLRWGLDNWVYCANGGHYVGFGADTKITSPRQGRSFELGSRDFRFQPDSGAFDPQSGPSQFGRVRDDWGNWFGVQNSLPLWHYVLADHYVRRNSAVPTIDPRRQLRSQAPPLFSAKPPQKRFHGFDHAGHYTSACGISIYRDEILFPRGQQHAFTCAPFHNLVQHHVLTSDGTSFLAERGNDGPTDFFASEDRWTRPVMSRTGPDGALWVVDMYRYMIEHPEWLPQAGKDELRPGYRAGEHMGRIYRVVPARSSPRKLEKWDQGSPRQIVDLVGHPNGIVRDLAHRFLLTKADQVEISTIEQLATEHASPAARLQAISLLDGLGKCRRELIREALVDPHPMVRRHAIGLVEKHADDDELCAAAMSLIEDDDAKVRLQLACTLGELTAGDPGQALAWLASRADNDRYMIAAIASSADRHYGSLVGHLVEANAPIQAELLQALLLTGENHRRDLARLLDSWVPHGESELAAVQARQVAAWLDLLQDRNQSMATMRASASDDLARVIGRLAKMANQARNLVNDEAAPLDSRLAAMDLLCRDESSFDTDLASLRPFLSASKPLPMQLAALRGVARVPRSDVAEEIVAAWPRLLPSVRSGAIEILSRRPDWTLSLLAAVGDGSVRELDISLSQRQRLLTSRNEQISGLAKQVFGAAPSNKRGPIVDRYLRETSLVGSVEQGRVLFEQHCKVCHAEQNSRPPIGPDLRTLTNRSPSFLLTAILDPSQAVEPQYVNYNVALQSGDVIVGLVKSEDSTAIELANSEGQQRTILRSSIEQLRPAAVSLMPEGFETKISPADMSHLLAYLDALGAEVDK